MGYLTITLSWDTQCDLDLYCTVPSGDKITYSNRNVAGGKLDIDANYERMMENPVENIFFTERPGAGSYKVEVNNCSSRISGPTKFTLLVEIGGATHYFEGAAGSGQTKHAATIKVMPAGGNPIVRVGGGAKAISDSAQGQAGTW